MSVYRVLANRDRCIGAGQCMLSTSIVFDQDDDGIVRVLLTEPPASETDAVRQAVELCPSAALSLTTEKEDPADHE